MTGSTVAAVIRCDDPVLRPGRSRAVRAVVSQPDGATTRRAVQTFEVTFTHAAVWDVARIASRVEVRHIQYPRGVPERATR